jgi:hypothetical protein
MTRKAAIAYRVRVTSEPSPHHRPLYYKMNIVQECFHSSVFEEKPIYQISSYKLYKNNAIFRLFLFGWF